MTWRRRIGERLLDDQRPESDAEIAANLLVNRPLRRKPVGMGEECRHNPGVPGPSTIGTGWGAPCGGWLGSRLRDPSHPTAPPATSPENFRENRPGTDNF